MEYKYFEKYLKETIGQHKSPIDEGALLASLGLEEESNRKGFGWKSAILGLFLFAVLGSFFMWYSGDTNQQIINDSHEQMQLSSDLDIDKEESIISTENTEAINNEEDQQEQITQSVVGSESITDESSDISSADLTTKSNQQHNVERNNTATLVKKSEKVSTPQVIRAEQLSDVTVGSKEIAMESINQEAKLEASSANTLDQMRTLYDLPAIDNDVHLLEYNTTSPINKQKIICPTFKEKNIWIELGAEAGVGLLDNKLNDNGHDITEALGERLEDEEGIETLNAKIFATLNTKKSPLGLKLGLGVERYANRMRYANSYIERDTTVGIISTTVSATGDTITHIYGDIITETTRTMDRKRHYYIYNINLPLGVTYSFPVGRNNIQLEAGAIFSLKSWSEGQILSGATGEFEEVDNQDINNSFGTSLYAQVNFMRYFDYGLAAYVAPYYRYDQKDYSGSDAFTQRYQSGGLKIGLIKSF